MGIFVFILLPPAFTIELVSVRRKERIILMRYQILDWDSVFFGLKVARITRPSLSREELADVLLELEHQHVRLVYWASDQEHGSTAISELHGSCVDQKIVFAVDLHALDFDDTTPDDLVEPYTELMSMESLEDLAVQSGKHSRFAVDHHFPDDKFVALYKTWINRSVRKEIATEVLVIRDNFKIIGMITLGETGSRGDIGLIAVDNDYRGRGYGEKLVRAAQKWFVKQGHQHGQVVTQGRNVPARKLYARRGYSVEQSQYVYHFWLPLVLE